jgi:4-hydroxy-tetrahydrodipicolinate synthase
MMAIGAEGLISVAANAFPREVSEMVRLANHSQFALAKSLHFSLQDLTDLLFVDGNPAGVKGVLEVLGICSQEVRLPLVPVTEKTLAALKKEMASLQMITI